ncbi:MAG: FAD-dependent thymidylate synthase [Firmicutes bacterium]|nr:FAD-dependent thymidylate synthase [Bacillota bacterium]
MEVKLLSHTPEPERVVATAARLCYAPEAAAEVWSGFTPEKQQAFIGKLVNYGHFSPFEHVVFTFAITGVSRALSHQLVRHRIASYSQRSQRYIDEAAFAVVVPPTVAADPAAREEFARVIGQIQAGYNRLTALGVPKEDARYLLPNACQTQLIMTMNARSLLHFFRLRCCRRAQWEIRELAWKIRREVVKVAPLLFREAGPACLVAGKCAEGTMTCGRPYTREEVDKVGSGQVGLDDPGGTAEAGETTTD